MNNQLTQEDQLCQKLLLEEFRYWNYTRMNVEQDHLEEIKKNIDEIRSTIRKSLSGK